MSVDTIYFVVILSILVLDFLWGQYLSFRNRKKMSPNIPLELVGIYSDDEYAKQQNYQKANSQFGLLSSFYSFVILLIFFCVGGFGWLDGILRQYVGAEWLITLLFFGVIYIVNEILTLPFAYYAVFGIEERFGFNKSTKRLFWVDQLKGLFVSIVVGGILLFVIHWLYLSLGNNAWLYAWGVVTLFSLFMLLFYSNVIVPLFNKQTPLAEGELRDAIERFAKQADFALDNIYVMDASKRSSKANAYFTGLGAKKRIVLYDTLINDLSTDEIVAVLAHEVGHYKKKHTLQMLATSILTTGMMLFLLSFILDNTHVATALGGSKASFHLGLIAFSVLFTPISMVLGIVTNIQSRKNEYQADAYAADFGFSEQLINGLKKLSVKSLSNLTPDTWYVFFHYSHPTLLQRMSALRKRTK